MMKKFFCVLIFGISALHESFALAGGNYLPCAVCQRDCRVDHPEGAQRNRCYSENCKEACTFSSSAIFAPWLQPIGGLLQKTLATPAGTTATGILLDSAWKTRLYDFVQKKLVHPSWGIAHSERDYQTAKLIAHAEGIVMDEDVLFAAAFLHDIGGLPSFAVKGVDHAQRSVQLIEPLLASWEFPMQKWPEVKDMILGHTYYGAQPRSRAALAFRDADVLDFLGNIGVARILAVAEEPGFSDGTLGPTVRTLGAFAQTMAAKCSLKTCQTIAVPRQQELQDFLDKLHAYTFSGKAL